MTMSRSMSLPALAIGLACAVPAIAHAAVIYDEITFQNASGTILASVTATPAEISADPNAVFYLSGVAIDPTQDGNYSDIVDGSGNPLEIFGVANGGPDGFDLGFAYQAVASGYPTQNPTLATGLPIDLTQYLDPSLQGSGYTATFLVSGLNSGVPEPLTWAMMVIGFAAMGYGVRRSVPGDRISLSYS